MRFLSAPTLGIAGLASGALLVLACGGSGTGATNSPSASLPASEVLRATESFLQTEGAQAQPGYFPTALRIDGTPEPAAAPAAACPARTVEHPSPTSTRITLDFSGCPQGPAGSVLGKLILTFTTNPPGWSYTYDAFTALSGTQMWQLDGTKGVSLNTAAQEATVQVQNFQVRYADSAHPENNRSFTYSSAITGSWATAGAYKVWGTYTLASTGDTPVTATIAREEALVYAAGCCYPTSGSIRFTKGGATATATFLPTCGSVSITAGGATATRTLEACR